MPDPDTNPQAAGGKKKKPRKGKTRELVECLLVAGALALGIRTFAFQIFKIPTRSMEPALIGNEDYGDRVVAAMWYKRGSYLPLKLGKLDRWQVIVFDHHVFVEKKRADGEAYNEKVRTNFIKRLIGLPGERIEIRDGDIWAGPSPGKMEIARKPQGVQDRVWIKLCDLSFTERWRVPYYWRVEPGIADGQAAAAPQLPGWSYEPGALVGVSAAGAPATLRWASPERLDNRFVRLTVKEVECPNRQCPRRGDEHHGYRFKAAFDTARPVVFCPDRECRAPIWGVHDDGSPGELIKDNNSNAAVSNYWTETGKGSPVSDLRLELDFEKLSETGRLDVTLTGRSEPFVFTLDLASGAARLGGGRKDVSGDGQAAIAAGRHRLVVANVDGEFRAELDDQPVAKCPYPPRSLPGNSNAEIAVGGGARVRLYAVKLYRDIYYGWAGAEMKPFDPCPDAGTCDRKASYIQMPDNGYLFLGDNQLASADGRSFGPKHDKDIVARGIFVVWPPSRFHVVW